MGLRMREIDLLRPLDVTRIRDAKTSDEARDAVDRIAGARGLKRQPDKPVRLSDGQGLYLFVEPSGAARWLFLFRWRGKLKEMGLGSLAKVPLKSARKKAQDAREMVGDGVNPIDARRAKDAIPTFGEVADELLAEIGKSFRNPKHLTCWQRSIGAPRPIKKRINRKFAIAGTSLAYADDLRPMRVDLITADHVYRLLKPLWSERHDTAARVRAHIARVFAAAKSAGYRTGDNPAAWQENLKDRLGARRKLTRGHRPALPYADVPAFVAALRQRAANSARALDFCILTASRLGEVRFATWGELDLEARLWVIPAERMKMARPHRVPLADDVLDILAGAALGSKCRPSDFVFPGNGGVGKPMSEAAMMTLIRRRMGYDGVTQHGFRSCFRDWAGDATSFPRDIIEQALAHRVGNEVELAYRRSDALERRREVMERWADYCAGRNNVVALASAVA